MQQTWRWFGPHDIVTLADARQAGAQGVVSSLHHRTPGELWPVEEIERRQAEVTKAGLVWSVVESVDVSDDIKTRTGNFRAHLDAYCSTLRNIAACGIHTVCYNFMPVLDWTRTNLNCVLPDGAIALGFDAIALAAFDLFLLKRPDAEKDWPEWRKRQAHDLFQQMSGNDKDALARTMLAGLPGTGTMYSMEDIRVRLARFHGMSAADLKHNLGEFLRTVCPVAEECGLRLCIHPDDPPRPLLGLPRVVSNAEDFQFLLDQSPEASNGITFCTGSLGARRDNDLPAMARRFASRIYFAHLRSVQLAEDGESFVEAPHLEGNAGVVQVLRELVMEERRRHSGGDLVEISFRPDHGHKLLTDVGRESVPGYPAIGRLRGLAELRGALRAIEMLNNDSSAEVD